MDFRDPNCTKACAYCGKLFARDKRCTWAHWGRAKFCSRACNAAAWSVLSETRRPAIEDAFAKYVTKTDVCWPWSGLQDKDGYGVFFHAKKQYRAPAFALKLDGRPVPKGMMACHTCDNPICVRPDHLYPGTPQQNVADMMHRGRANHAKKLTAEQAVQIRNMSGGHGEIASAFGVSRSNVSQIKEGKIWRNVQ